MRAIGLCFGLCSAFFVLTGCGSRLPIGGSDAGDARVTDASMDVPRADAVTECVLPNDRRCPVGTTCELSRCADGSTVSCYCDPSGAPRCTGACVTPDGGPDVTPPPDAASECILSGGVRCPVGMTCEISRCPDGTPVSCFCAPGAMPRCTGACPPITDAGSDVTPPPPPDASEPDVTPPPPPDAEPPPPPPDASGECALPGGGLCPVGSVCEIGRCPDGTPVSCFCAPDGALRCTGGCPPPPPPPTDAGPPDCRTTGCPAGQHCDACLSPGGVVYACIPEGSAC